MLTLRSFLRSDDPGESKFSVKDRPVGTRVIAGMVTAAALLILIGSDSGLAKGAVPVDQMPYSEEKNNTKAKIQLGFDKMTASVTALSDNFTSDKLGINSDMKNEPQKASVNIKKKARSVVGKLTILNDKDYRNLIQIVEAEAGGEDIKGRILVANVILNRVKSKFFPDNVTDVIYQRKGKHVQFSPVGDGRIKTVTPQKSTKEAVQRALAGEDYARGALYFSAREAADPNSMQWFDRSLTWLFRHGHHEFYK